MSDDVLIVTRHIGAVEWLRRRGVAGQVVAKATPDLVRNKVVAGILPTALAAETREYWAIELPDVPFHLTGKRDLSAEEMEEAKARLVAYRVERLRRID